MLHGHASLIPAMMSARTWSSLEYCPIAGTYKRMRMVKYRHVGQTHLSSFSKFVILVGGPSAGYDREQTTELTESSLEGFHFFISFQLTFTLTSLMLLGLFASTVLNVSHCESVVTLNGELAHPLRMTVQHSCIAGRE